jgi:Sigma-70 region 2
LNFSSAVGSLTYEAHVSATPQQLYEQTLVLRSQIGDETAFRELLELYGPHLLRYTRKMMESSPTLVEDLVQEIWVAIYRGLPGLLDAGKFRPWAFRIARDKVMFLTAVSMALLSIGTLVILLLVIFNRRITLRQINISLAQISAQIKELQNRQGS